MAKGGEGPRISRSTKQVKQSKGAGKGGRPMVYENFNMPTLSLLAEPKHVGRTSRSSDELLEQNARMLEGVLDDFGVSGEIINVRPGPVVTLYELEPAPGIKSSRVIGLADDIARSMSAVSARVAVVPGRNVIGIELPNANAKRFTCASCSVRRPSRRPARACRWRSARISAASRSSPISPACRIC